MEDGRVSASGIRVEFDEVGWDGPDTVAEVGIPSARTEYEQPQSQRHRFCDWDVKLRVVGRSAGDRCAENSHRGPTRLTCLKLFGRHKQHLAFCSLTTSEPSAKAEGGECTLDS